MVYPSFEEAGRKAAGVDFVPVAMETFADMETPVSVFKRFKDTSPYCFLLDSVEGGEKWARYSFIAKDPLLTIRVKDQTTVIQYRDGRVENIRGNPYQIVQDLMSNYKGAKVESMPRLSGGIVGFFGYDLIRSIENLPNPPKDDLDVPTCHFMLVDETIVFDHLQQKLVLIVNMPTKGDLRLNYDRTVERLKVMDQTIRESAAVQRIKDDDRETAPEKAQVQSNISKEDFCDLVAKAKEYINNGDIFQIVLSQRFSMPALHDPLDVYRYLRVSNPSPYMYFLKFKDYCIVGSSPEMLVRCENGIVETCPIAGTRKRGETEEADRKLEEELLEDPKELAEHIMLVDLGRNDIGKVAKFGTVEVSDYMSVLRYSQVMHIGSTVRGEMREDKTSFDALMAVLPAGTLSGAPKIRAMEIIDELETTQRSIYGGAIGFIAFDGSLDCCIAIRTILFKDGMAYVQAGCGVVADSVPEREYEETENKARAVIKALQEVGGII
ncbi:anthranilate synthase, component I [Syntrophobotulus glycolicus DSM 8271]|uniref:Anthranilate synthase component 1 n=1 Tax=Syntrophobotulus glycolicus (strain DSM 8271 / FlGlyR) TaxID=645991 RepID=F0SZ26_SYNGF|nr:anthranilate synthase component I [Syntrophobotulus glycolicus]ADY57144.1 anthranilate synthase, component I [Syntrophobotulus glycolicus DSM 8271]